MLVLSWRATGDRAISVQSVVATTIWLCLATVRPCVAEIKGLLGFVS